MDLIKRVLTIAFWGFIVVVLVNDVGRFAQAQYTVGNVARESAVVAAQEARRTANDREQSWRAAEQHAQTAGATVYGYDIKNEFAYVWLRMPVQGTIALQPLMSFITNRNTTTPLTVEDQNQSLIQ